MPARRIVLLLALGAVAALSLFAWRLLREHPAPAASHAAADAATAPAPTLPPPPAPAQPTEATAVRTPVTGAAKPRRGMLSRLFGAGQEEQDDGRKIGVDATIVVTAADGSELRTESGTARPGFYDPPGAEAEGLPHGIGRSWRTGEEIAVVEGRFHVDVPEGKELGLVSATLRGRPLAIDGDPVAVKAGEPVTLRGHWLAGVRVHVVDAATQAELDDVTVAPSSDHWIVERYPGGDVGAPILEHAPSPVTLTPANHEMFGVVMQATFWIRARDHAWKSLELDFSDASDRTVELAPAATLIVTVEGELPHRAALVTSLVDLAKRSFGGRPSQDDSETTAQLRLRTPVEPRDFDDVVKEALDHYDEAQPSDFPGGTKPSLEDFRKLLESMRGQFEAETSVGELLGEQPAKLGETRLEGLEPGAIEVLLELGAAHRSPLVAARARAELRVGETARVTLTGRPVAVRRPVPLAGTLLLPAGWPTADVVLRIEPLDLAGKTSLDERRITLKEMVAPAGANAPYRFDAGLVAPATYAFAIREVGFSRTLAIGEAGDEHVALVVPEPGLLHVRIVDSVSGAPVRLKNVSWGVATDDLFPGSPAVDLAPDADGARYSARVPVGMGAVRLFGAGEWCIDEQLPTEIHAGEQEITVRAHRACGVAVSFTCDGKRISLEDDLLFKIELESLGPESHQRSWSEDDEEVRLGVSNPGRYRVKIPPIGGYLPVDPIEIEVPAGQFVPLEVRLQRR